MKKKQPTWRAAIVVTWHPSKVPCRFGFIQALTNDSSIDVTELDHIGGQIIVPPKGARIGQRVELPSSETAA